MDWKDSVFSDGSALFLSSAEPQLWEEAAVSIRFWTGSPVEEVWVRLIRNGGHVFERAVFDREEGGFSYYIYRFKMNQKRMQYQFLLKTADRVFYYSQAGLSDCVWGIHYDFVILADYHQPDWIRNAVFYQIFPERFCSGDPSLSVTSGEYQVNGYDTIQIEDWNTPAGTYDSCHCADFYGGDLIGIRQKIPYLKSLGVTSIYLNPIFAAPSVHKYDCIDYLTVDPHFGGNQALADLSEALHENGMQLILDISINHTGTAHKWFNKDGLFYDTTVGAYHNPQAQERAYYSIHEDGSYECWDGVPELPKLNFDSDELREALYRGPQSVLKKWLQPPYSIDGWRFDVADVMANFNEKQLAAEVWPEIRKSIREVNPEAYILAEHWDDCSSFLQGDSWDATMNYYGFGRLIRQFYGAPDPFFERTPGLWPFTCGITAEDFRRRVEMYLSRLPFVFWQEQYNLYDSHDIGRFLSYPGITEEKIRGTVIAMFTMIGIPSIYYGDELGIEGQIGFFEGARYPMPWNTVSEENSYYRLHRQLTAIRKAYKVLSEGSFRFLYAMGQVLAFARFDQRNGIVTVLSASEKEEQILVPVSVCGQVRAESVKELMGAPLSCYLEEGNLQVTVPAGDAYMIYFDFVKGSNEQ